MTPLLRIAREALPHGHALPEATFAGRHRALIGVVVAHLPALFAVAVAHGYSAVHAFQHLLPIVALAVAAALLPSRRLRILAASAALLTCSAVAVHVTGGLIEAHFHFFVVMTLLAFYEDWGAYGLALAYVVVHHGLVGAILPLRVFDHAGASDGVAAWTWAAVHGAFILASAVANLLLWRSNERSRVLAAEREHARRDAEAAAGTLAETLVPATLPVLAHARAAVSSVPGDGRAGGDWLDVVALGCGRTAVMLGDVAGHGVAAAALSARLRYTSRAYAEDGRSPAAILERLDRCMDGASATALVALVDPEAEQLTYARAGHLPPVLRLPGGGTRLLEDAGGPLLAGLGLPYADVTVPFPAGATLVAFSDGLVERRGESIDAGLDRVRALVERSDGEPAGLATGLGPVLADGAATDDAAVLAVRTSAPARPPVPA